MEDKVTRDVEDRETLKAVDREAELRLELMEDWNKRIADADEKAPAAISQVFK